MTDFHLSTVVFKFIWNLSHVEQCSCCAYNKIKTIRVEVGMPNVAGERAEANHVSVCHQPQIVSKVCEQAPKGAAL